MERAGARCTHGPGDKDLGLRGAGALGLCRVCGCVRPNERPRAQMVQEGACRRCDGTGLRRGNRFA